MVDFVVDEALILVTGSDVERVCTPKETIHRHVVGSEVKRALLAGVGGELRLRAPRADVLEIVAEIGVEVAGGETQGEELGVRLEGVTS